MCVELQRRLVLHYFGICCPVELGGLPASSANSTFPNGRVFHILQFLPLMLSRAAGKVTLTFFWAIARAKGSASLHRSISESSKV